MKNLIYLSDVVAYDYYETFTGSKHLTFRIPTEILQGYFKATKVKIACGVSSVRAVSKLVIGRLFSFDDLDRDKD